MPSDPIREAFEAWCRGPGDLMLVRTATFDAGNHHIAYLGDYSYLATQKAWESWQAAVAWERGQRTDAYDSVPLADAGSVTVRTVDGGELKPIETDDV